MDRLTAKKLISKTRDDYNLIADQFASTRKFNWGDFALALESIPLQKGAKVLDMGCGNGRIFELLKNNDIEYYGLDISNDLIKHAQKNIPKGQFVVCDLLNTPYKDNEFDLVLCVATLHHIPSKEARERAVAEIYRITKPGGYTLATTWYFWKSQRHLKGIINTALAKAKGKTELDVGDFFMIWKNGNGDNIAKRYFHAWRKGEIIHAFKRAGFKSVHATFYLKDGQKIGNNLITIARKPK